MWWCRGFLYGQQYQTTQNTSPSDLHVQIYSTTWIGIVDDWFTREYEAALISFIAFKGNQGISKC
jgi:hypothetical protein